MKEEIIIDGRKARWFDCNWNNDSIVENDCEICKICKYKNFLNYAESVGSPAGTRIEYNKKKDEYIKIRTISEKKRFILNELK